MRLPIPLALLLLCGAALPPATAEDELTAEDAVASAVLAQPGLKAAEAQARAASARARQAGWQRVGTLETSALYTPGQRPLRIEFPGIPDLVPPQDFEVKQLHTYALNLSLTQPLWTWGALQSQHGAAQKEAGASEQNVDRARQRTVFEASQAFFLAATASAAVSVAEQSLAQQQAFLRAAESRARAGSAARLDVLKAQLAVTRAESQLVEARNRERLARELLVTVSLDERFRSAPLEPVGEDPLPLPAEQDAVTLALDRRPDLRSLRQQGEALGLRGKAIRGSSLPALSFRAQLTQQHDELTHALSREGQIYQVGLLLTWDATSPFRNREKLAELEAAREALAQTLRGAEEGAGLEVRTAHANASEAEQQVRVARRALETAEEQARVARLAYGEGVASALEANDAELGLTAARVALLRAKLDAAVAHARLQYATGG